MSINIDTPWGAAISAIGGIIEKVLPDPAAKAAAQAQLALLNAQGALQEDLVKLQAATTNQSAINQAEASNPSMFVAGWRPAVGWICAAALGMQFLFGPTVTWVAGLLGHPLTFPTLDSQTLMTLLFGMLGLGAYRSFEKVKGVDTTAVGN
jgi:hypothetical protein